MTYITKQELKKIIDNRPLGTTPEGIVSGLRQRGNQLEGYQETPEEKVQKKTLLDKVGSFLGVEKLAKGIAGTIFSKTKEGKNVLKMLEEGKMTYEEFQRDYGEILPSGKEIIGSALQTAATIGTAGISAGKILPTAAKVGGIGAVSGFGRGLEEEKTIKESAIRGLTTGLISAGTYATLAGVSNLIKKAPARLMNSAVKPPNPKLGQELVNRGLVGSEKSMLKTSIDKIMTNESKLDGLLSGKKGTIKSSDILKILAPLKEKYKNSPSILKIIDTEAKKWITESSYTTLDANIQKRVLYELLNDRAYQVGIKHSAQTQVIKSLANRFKTSIEKIVPEAKSINLDLGVYIQARNALNKRLINLNRAQLGIWGDILAGAGGGLFAGLSSGGVGIPAGAIGAIATRRIGEKAITKTSTAWILNQIQKIPTDTAGKISKIALINLLKGTE